MNFDRVIHNSHGQTLIYPRMKASGKYQLKDGDVDPYAQGSIQEFPLGTMLIIGDRVWRYCKNGAGTPAAGAPLEAAAVVHAEQPDDIVVGAAAAAGDYNVDLTSTANLDGDPNDDTNDFAEGWLVVNDEAGEGHCYQIESNEGFSTTDLATFVLYDPLVVALTVASQVGLARSKYYRVISSPGTTPTGICIGIAPRLLTAAYYFWAQTKGPCAVIAHAVIAVGAHVASGLTAGKVDPTGHDATYGILQTQQIIGRALTLAAADGESFIVDLNLD